MRKINYFERSWLRRSAGWAPSFLIYARLRWKIATAASGRAPRIRWAQLNLWVAAGLIIISFYLRRSVSSPAAANGRDAVKFATRIDDQYRCVKPIVIWYAARWIAGFRWSKNRNTDSAFSVGCVNIWNNLATEVRNEKNMDKSEQNVKKKENAKQLAATTA